SSSRLAERLLASLDEEDEILNEWIAVAEARLDALDRGEAQTVALESVLKDIRAGLRK
ncbi:MAG: putative addiction module component, partial [Pseudomonadota bacterium]